MLAEIIIIGDEILIGQVIDTNSGWMARRLGESGIRVVHMSCVSDSASAIRTALDEALNRAGLVILTGGLGPTHDDITKEVLCEYFGCKMVLDQKAYALIEEKYKRRGLEVSPLNRRQAELPDGCRPLYNKLGTATGMWFEKKGGVIVSLPGVPHEMKALVDEQVIPLVREKYALPVVFHKTVLTAGLGESDLAERVAAWREGLPAHIGLAFLPSPGMVRMRLSGSGADTRIGQEIDKHVSRLLPLIGKHVFGYDDTTLEAVVGKLLRERQATVSVAESCTGGYLTHLLTSVPGSSDYLKGSVVAYDNEVKSSLLGVPASLIEKHGAVSEQVAKAMALQAKEKFDSTYSLSTTGIAGPGGAAANKPVGTVWIALASPHGVYAKNLFLSEHRLYNITVSSVYALNRLRLELLEPA